MTAAPTITALDVRVVNPPLAVPHATAGGLVASYPMVLLDLRTSADVTGCAYVFTYTMLAAPAKIGGITSWRKIAAMAEVYGLPLSNHLFAEVSAHLMAASPTAGWFEWCDWPNPVLAQAVEVRDGQVWPSAAPGIGIEWNEAAIARHRVDC